MILIITLTVAMLWILVESDVLRYVKKKDFFRPIYKSESNLVRGLTPRKRKSLLKTCRPRWFEAFLDFWGKALAKK